MTSTDTFRQSLMEAGLGRVASQLTDALEPSVSIQTAPLADDAIPVGASKFGGQPDVPVDFEWPLWNGAPLSFLGQINLANITQYACTAALPPTGLLSFFYDPEQSTWGFDPKDRGSWSVRLTSNSDLQRATFPAGLPDHARYTPCQLTFSDSMTPISWQSDTIEKLELSDEELDLYMDLMESEDSLRHHLFGLPQEVQNEMQLKCQLVSNGIYCGDLEGYEDTRVPMLKPGAADWRLLLQIDSDDNAGWMWGDSGRLYFWITNDSLQSRKFENIWMILQCG